LSVFHLLSRNDGPAKLKNDANFWYKIWDQAGRPFVVLCMTFRKITKKKYKSSVRCLKRRQLHVHCEKLAHPFSEKKKGNFWAEDRQLNRSSTSSLAPVVDGVSGHSDIANLFASNLLSSFHSRTMPDSLCAFYFVSY
jgi:hypothetical protein